VLTLNVADADDISTNGGNVALTFIEIEIKSVLLLEFCFPEWRCAEQSYVIGVSHGSILSDNWHHR
jgi:hypothetical protein